MGGGGGNAHTYLSTCTGQGVIASSCTRKVRVRD